MQASFSVRYVNDQNKPATLDLVAQNKADFLLWTQGLEKAIHIVKNRGEQLLKNSKIILMGMPISATYVSYVKYWGSSFSLGH